MYSRNVTYLYFYNLTFRKTNIYCSKHSIKHNFLQIYTFSTRREQTDLCWHLRVVFFFFFQSLWRLVRLVLQQQVTLSWRQSPSPEVPTQLQTRWSLGWTGRRTASSVWTLTAERNKEETQWRNYRWGEKKPGN